MAELPKSGPPTLDIGTGIADFTLTISQGLSVFKILRLMFHQAVQYVERIPDAQEAVGAVLLSLGVGNRRMGDGMPITKILVQVMNKSLSSISCVRPFSSLPAFLFSVDLVSTVYANLSSISKSQKRPFFGSIYLNNVAHFRMHILLEPRNKNIMPLLSKPTRDAFNSNFRLAKSEYFNSNFMSLLGVLADEPSGGKSGGKAATKEKFTKFF